MLWQPAAPGRNRLGRSVWLEGAWKLSRAHELVFNARHPAGAPLPEHAFLKASITGAGPDSLELAWERDSLVRGPRRRLRLAGRWQADATNRLAFFAERADGGEDRLTFSGAWEVGPRHELRYRYRRPGRGRREHALSFDGSWDVAGRSRLAYRLSGSAHSVFEFRASLQSRSLNARDQALVYQIGIGAESARTTRRVALFGRWKVNRDLSVAFEIPYAGGRFETIRFEGAWTPGPGRQASIALSARNGRPLGLSVTFSRELAPDRQVFLQLRKQDKEKAVIGGVTVRF